MFGRLRPLGSVVRHSSVRHTSVFSASPLTTVPDGSLDRPEAEWLATLPRVRTAVLRRKGTEPGGVGVADGGFDDHFEAGVYNCSGCATPLYDSRAKFDCGCGWPGFYGSLPNAVREQPEDDGRSEVVCNACNGHLGHNFRNEGYQNPFPNERHCVNSVALTFQPSGAGKIIESSYDGEIMAPSRFDHPLDRWVD